MVKNTATNYLFNEYRSRMKRRGLDFNIPYELFLKLIAMKCYLCGVEPRSRCTRNVRGGRGKRYGKVTVFYNGLDRVDNSKGYVVGNVAPCCGACNSIKSERTLEELAGHLRLMLENLGGLKFGQEKKGRKAVSGS